jgi:predicted flap endonuclease-1-like 5' DNA nuclease
MVAAVDATPTAPEAPAATTAAEAAPASPQTPAGTVESVDTEETPVSPETPAAQASAEAAPASPETAEANVMSADRQEPSHMARTEYAEPERIAEKDAPPAPPPDESLEASEKTSPEAQVVMETTADPALPYETEQTGEVTPGAAEDVAQGRGEDTHIAQNLTETASPKVSQQATGDTAAGTADDLTRIDGIGPKSATALRSAGIDSFQKLANTPEAQLVDILRAANVRLVGSTSSWAQQAAYAAQGDWEGFNRFNREHRARGEQ